MSTPVGLALAAALAAHEQRVLRSPSARTRLLEGWAERLAANEAAIVDVVGAETALPPARVTGELGRTVGQLRMFADVVRDGSWVDVRVEPGPPDIRRMLVPLGPVAVFGASNFPLAFSTPGGDTASALAAGCPVVVKAHPAHPRTAELTAGLLEDAPDGVFQQVTGGADVGAELVTHPHTAAVAFTGSLAAGRSLFDLAAARPRPIPVFAEMGSINPLFVLPGALASRSATIAKGLAESVTLGVGQFCTKPGVVVGVGLDDFADRLGAELAAVAPGTMLTEAIGEQYAAGVARLGGTAAAGVPACITVDAGTFMADPALHEEVFGPVTVVVSCRDDGELLDVARSFDGQLTASIHADGDAGLVAPLVELLVERAGRIVWNGYPTGVTVNRAMQHGGPYPASTDSRFTSVGTAAIARFARPVAFQDVPDDFLPTELQ